MKEVFYPIDKKIALERIRELDKEPFLTDEQLEKYKRYTYVVEEKDRQFRNNWKSDRRAWIKAQVRKKYMTQEQADEQISQLDSTADLILGKPIYPWSKTQ